MEVSNHAGFKYGLYSESVIISDYAGVNVVMITDKLIGNIVDKFEVERVLFSRIYRRVVR
jgi:hypothetical protein